MRYGVSRLIMLGLVGMALAACQGNIGSGGLSIPQQGAYGQPGGPQSAGGGVGQSSRQRVVEGAVYLAPEMTEFPLPTIDGYGVTIALGTPTPTPSPTASPSGKPLRLPRALATRRPTRDVVVAQARPLATPSASATPSPAATASAGTSPAPSASPTAKPPKTATKTVLFPDAAPAAPSPQATGNVQTFAMRKPIVRGYLMPGKAFSLYGLAAIRFTVPKTELTNGRGFTVAVFADGKHHSTTLLASDDTPTIADTTIVSTHADAIAFKPATGYDIVLYGDEQAPEPTSVPSGYPAPGNNPFVTPYPGQSGMPGAIGTPNAFGSPGYPPPPGSYVTPLPH